jgi:hydroxyethylthiazole kinase-like uncharacterized protein yjeF
MKPKPLDYNAIKAYFPKRPKDSFKNDFGHVLIIGGGAGMAGAARIASEASLRMGAGLVSVASLPGHTSAIIARHPEIMCHGVETTAEVEPLLARATVLAIGPGLGKTFWAKDLWNATIQSPLPKVVDADALNLLAENPQTSNHWILTPHVGEAARLLNTSSKSIQADRIQSIVQLQKSYQGVVVLKGSGTLIYDGTDLSICEAGNPGMASGGMGDCLTGIIVGLLAQHFSLTDAAKIGVYLHAHAGDMAAQQLGERGLLATDLIPYLQMLVNPDESL